MNEKEQTMALVIIKQDIIDRCEELLILAKRHNQTDKIDPGGDGWLYINEDEKTITYEVAKIDDRAARTHFTCGTDCSPQLDYDHDISLREIQDYLIKGRKLLLDTASKSEKNLRKGVKWHEQSLRRGVKNTLRKATPPFLISPLRQAVNRIWKVVFYGIISASTIHLLWTLRIWMQQP